MRQKLCNWQKTFFNNITIDLIYGTPLLTNEKWKQNVETALNSDIPHLSCYALTIEVKTPLYKMIREHKTDDVNPDQTIRTIFIADALAGRQPDMNIMKFPILPNRVFRAGIIHPTGKGKNILVLVLLHIHSMALPGNGIFPTIISILNPSTRELFHSKKKNLTSTQKLNEYIMTSLRTIEGLNLEKVKEV